MVKEFRKYCPKVFELEDDNAIYEWLGGNLLTHGFYEACNNTASSYLKVGDESMSAIFFQKIAKGNLPHLYYIFHNPEPLGKEFKTVTYSFTDLDIN